jgi:hypothetical protein
MPQNTGLAIFDSIASVVTAVMGEPEALTLTRAGEAPIEFRGLFDARSVEIVYDNSDAVITEYQTFVFTRRDAVPDVHRDDVVTVRGATYRVTDIEPDSEGGVKLFLSQIDNPAA